jgi:hypothetical protein
MCGSMNLLAIETSTALGSIAVWKDGDILLRRACPGDPAALGDSPAADQRATLCEAASWLCRPACDRLRCRPRFVHRSARGLCRVAQGLAVSRSIYRS